MQGQVADGLTDAALLAATAAGDTAAFAAFMRAHQGPVQRHLVTFTGHEDVDDALQETFIAAWRGAAGFHGVGSARAWLFTIARNTVRHQVRRRVGEPESLESLESLDALAVRAGWGASPDGAAYTDAAVARDLVQAAFARLPQDEREILSLREIDALSGDETAELLQISLAAMKSRLHRARIHLAAVLRTLESSTHSTRATNHD